MKWTKTWKIKITKIKSAFIDFTTKRSISPEEKVSHLGLTLFKSNDALECGTALKEFV